MKTLLALMFSVSFFFSLMMAWVMYDVFMAYHRAMSAVCFVGFVLMSVGSLFALKNVVSR